MKAYRIPLFRGLLSSASGLAVPTKPSAGMIGRKSESGLAIAGLSATISRSSSNRRVDDPHRRFFDKITKDSNAVIDDANDAVRLFQAAVSFANAEGTPELLYRLADRNAAHAGALRKALEHVDVANPVVFKKGFLPFLELLGRDELNKPVYRSPLNTLLSGLYTIKFMMPQIKAHLEEGVVESNDERTSLIWFLNKIALAHADARSDSRVQDIAETLCSNGGKASDHLITVLEGSKVDNSLSGLRMMQKDKPGGRHDNDLVDFRSVEILPTPEEIMCNKEPYLPKAKVQSPMTTSQLLDRQFRLLREDIIGRAKEQLNDPRKQQRDVYYSARISRIESGKAVHREEGGKQIQVSGPSDPCICFSLQVPRWHHVSKMNSKPEKAKYWEKNQRALARGALVALLRKSASKEWVPVRFGVIKRRKIEELATQAPSIGITFFNEKDTADTIQELFDPYLPPTRLMVVSSDLFAYQPILEGLQSMDAIPFSEEILAGKRGESTGYSPSIPDEIQDKVEKLDAAQRTALEKTLRSRVSLIHGPPGTGKTSVGVMLAQSIVATTTERILCVCYTNHALDDFLENLLDAGITDIVRLGGQSKNARLGEYNLREKAKSGKTPFSPEQTARYSQLKGEIKLAEEDIDRLQKECGKEIGAKCWPTVGPFLEDTNKTAWLQLQVDETDLIDGDGSKVLRMGGNDRLWKRWLKGLKPSKPFASRGKEPLWKLSKTKRRKQKLMWQEVIYEEKRKELTNALSTIQRAISEIKQLHSMQDLQNLSSARVIGCTTTKAAMCKELLDDVSPGVVLVEEAAEILEAHVITSLSSNTKHLIMIGDHKQLRPKVQHYPLTVESGRGFDLNLSLFERLATMLSPFTLDIQHRMHPDISQIPKIISYPELQDASSVASHPEVKGLQSRVIFVNHSFNEDRWEHMTETLDSHSKTNQHEVDMVVATVRFLLQQGYSPSDLVVLTPYLGQLWRLQEALASHCDAVIGDLDYNDARKHLQGIKGFDFGPKPKAAEVGIPVRVATIDNYQGEESNIAIISLVRGNPNYNIGFLNEPERVNVMFSRAKHGQIIFGNLATLCNARGSDTPLRGGNLWHKISSYLQSKRQIFYGLPTKCQLHGKEAMLQQPEDFMLRCPDGGCGEICGKLLDCGHSCTRRCHVGPCSRCNVLVEDRCPQGHILLRRCSFDRPKCHRTITWRCPQGHLVSGECFKGKFSIACKHCKRLEVQQDKLVEHEARLQKVLETKQVILQNKKELLAQAYRESVHEDHLQRIEKELELAENELRGHLTTKAQENKFKHNIQLLPGHRLSPCDESIPIEVPDPKPKEKTKDITAGLYSPIFAKSSDSKLSDNTASSPSKASIHSNYLSLVEPKGVESATPHSDTNNVDDQLRQVLDRYSGEGAVAADNLLDQMNNLQFLNESIELQALRTIIQKELNPQGETGLFPERRAAFQTILSKAICSWASALSNWSDFPLTARDSALELIEFHQLSKTKIIPKDWIEQAEEIIQQADAMILTQESPKKPGLLIDRSPSASDRWTEIEINDPEAPKVMRESILPMIGLEAVKQNLLNAYQRIRLAQEQKDGAASSYNVRFEGNPGTGKTRICRHYGTFLQQLAVLPAESIFKETSGSKLVHEGVKGLQEILNEVKIAGGGVVFVDEAYQLASDREGTKVLDFILPLAENLESREYGKLVWVFAGYKKPMEELFKHNEGLPSRFPQRFVFEDYTDEELRSIFEDFMVYNLESSSGNPKPVLLPRRHKGPPPDSFSRSHGHHDEVQTDRFGHQWTYDQDCGWTDEFGNHTVAPSRVGTQDSKLVEQNGRMWTDRSGIWEDDSGQSQNCYPGDFRRRPRENPFDCDSGHLLIAIRRLGRRRGDRGFGNARAVRALFDRVRDRQAARIAEERTQGNEPDIYCLERTDLLGPDISEDTLKNCQAWRELESLEGLVPVKESVTQLFNVVLENLERENNGKPLLDVTLNRLFLGNPGTGKTTVAELYGNVLVELGLLSKGEVILKSASDFVGDVLGSSEKTTKNILQAAKGNVLVIDEAYSLYSGGSGSLNSNDPYKTAVIDTIVEQVQAKPGDDIAVVMLGYKEEMEEMMRKVNPGLSRRFQIDDAFIFPDFDDAALLRILMAKARKRGLELEMDVAKRAIRSLAKARARPHFGNAGAVDNILSKAVQKMANRKGTSKLTADDFDYAGDNIDDGALTNLFADLIGCDEVRNTMDELRCTVEFSRSKGRHPCENIGFNYLFLGSPGTGKTTVARRMGQLFMELDLLPSDEMREIKASDLSTGFAGQAGKQTRDILRGSLGGCLFVDEAYQLNPKRGGEYMAEVVDELVGALTEQEFRGKLLVILAGYDQDMENMLETNPGLKSRFSERVHFHNFDVDATVCLLIQKLDKKGIPLASDDTVALNNLAQKLVESNGFGNGRDVDTWADHVYREVAKSQFQKDPSTVFSSTSSLENLEKALDRILQSRIVRADGPKCTTAEATGRGTLTQSQSAPTPAILDQSIGLDATNVKCEDMQLESEQEGEMQPNFFDSIDRKVLQTLQSVLDEEGWNDAEGAQRLANLDPNSAGFANLVTRLQEKADINIDDAKVQLIEWQAAQDKLKEKMAQLKKQTVGVRPLWRCAVCGRANKPWIACHVAPYICGYEKIVTDS